MLNFSRTPRRRRVLLSGKALRQRFERLVRGEEPNSFRRDRRPTGAMPRGSQPQVAIVKSDKDLRIRGSLRGRRSSHDASSLLVSLRALGPFLACTRGGTICCSRVGSASDRAERSSRSWHATLMNRLRSFSDRLEREALEW